MLNYNNWKFKNESSENDLYWLLITVIENREFYAVKELVEESDVDINAHNLGPLREAIRICDKKIINYLLEKGVDIKRNNYKIIKDLYQQKGICNFNGITQILDFMYKNKSVDLKDLKKYFTHDFIKKHKDINAAIDHMLL